MTWSSTSQYLAILRHTTHTSQIKLWVLDCTPGKGHVQGLCTPALPPLPTSCVFSMKWSSSGQFLAVAACPSGQCESLRQEPTDCTAGCIYHPVVSAWLFLNVSPTTCHLAWTTSSHVHTSFREAHLVSWARCPPGPRGPGQEIAFFPHLKTMVLTDSASTVQVRCLRMLEGIPRPFLAPDASTLVGRSASGAELMHVDRATQERRSMLEGLYPHVLDPVWAPYSLGWLSVYACGILCAGSAQHSVALVGARRYRLLDVVSCEDLAALSGSAYRPGALLALKWSQDATSLAVVCTHQIFVINSPVQQFARFSQK